MPWVKTDEIRAERSREGMGSALAMSNDGSTIAIGSENFDDWENHDTDAHDYNDGRISNYSFETFNLITGLTDILTGIKDYDENKHGYIEDAPDLVKSAYKYQGRLDVNNDGITEAIFTNKESGRWVTASIDPITGAFDYSKHGQGGTTRIVGIYEDPLVKAGVVEKIVT